MAKTAVATPKTITEEEALRAELLAATEEHQNKGPRMVDSSKKIDGGRTDVMKEQAKIKNKP